MDKTPVYLSTNLTIERPCPVCHAKLDGLTCMALDKAGVTDTMRLGDLTLCAYCGAILILTELGFQVATPEHVATVPDVLQRAWGELERAKKGTH